MRNDTIETTTITITDLADVLPGDIVTAEHVPHHSEGAAIVYGVAYKGELSSLWLAGMVLRHSDGANGDFLRFVSATREVPTWEPDEDEVRCLAQSLAAAIGAPTSDWVAWRADATHLLTYLHDNGWRKDAPTEPEPVDPVMDETDKRDRIDSDGDKWHWSVGDETWRLGVYTAKGNLAALDRHYGPLTFADEEADA